MQDELPLALIEEQAEGEVTAQKCSEDGEGERFQKPGWIDSFELCRLLFTVV